MWLNQNENSRVTAAGTCLPCPVLPGPRLCPPPLCLSLPTLHHFLMQHSGVP